MANIFSNIGSAQPPEALPVKDGRSSYTNNYGIIPQYQVMLDVRNDNSVDSSGRRIFPLIGNLSEQFNLEFSSTWDSPFSRTGINDLISKAIGANSDTVGNILSASGFSNRIKQQTAQVWQESSPLSFNIEMVFRAHTNSLIEVKDRHRALLKLAAPSELANTGGAILMAPGPTISGKIISPNSRQITLFIGKYLTIKDVIIKSVSSDVECLFDESGIPLSMTIALGVESFYSSFSCNDIDRMFGVIP